MKILRDKEYQFIVKIIGSGSQKDYLEALVGDLGLVSTFQFVGKINHESVFDQLFQADVSVVPSRAEAFGNVVLESMAVGTPVIGSNTGGIKEIITDDVDGCLFEPENETDLAKKIEMVFLNREKLREMGIHARNTFVTRFLDETAVREQADWLEKITQE